MRTELPCEVFRRKARTDARSQIGLLLISLLIVVPSFAQLSTKVHTAPDFGSGDVWLDQGAPVPHHISGYRGRVVLMDFWEYTCINCIRDFGVLKRWYSKYHPYGLEIIGVHYGEFSMGFNVDNVRAAAQGFRLPWPVVADQQGNTWRAYDCKGWPSRFLIDPQGKIVMEILGEVNNREMEEKIRQLLAVSHPEVMNVALEPEEKLTPQCGIPTQETYLGQLYGRGAIENLDGHQAGDTVDFLPPHTPSDGGVMLVGRWRVEHDGVVAEGHGAAAELRYHARTLYSVMGPSGTKGVRVDLFQDGVPLTKDAAGADVQFDSKGAYIEVNQPRMYYLVRGPFFAAHLITLQPQSSGLVLDSFTYGNNCELDDRPY